MVIPIVCYRTCSVFVASTIFSIAFKAQYNYAKFSRRFCLNLTLNETCYFFTELHHSKLIVHNKRRISVIKKLYHKSSEMKRNDMETRRYFRLALLK
jgi:hypothetical protein